MKTYRYLIIGGGMTAAAAVEGIREIDREGSLALFSKETDPPYDRPPLSKALWKDGKVEKIWRHVDDRSVDLYLDHPIVRLRPSDKIVQDEGGNEFQFEKCLVATGGSPRHLPFGEDRILYYRTLADYQRLKQDVQHGGKFVVIGGGFIGSEIAAALCMNEQQVSIAFPEEWLGAKMFPPDLAKFITEVYRQKGVNVLGGRLVKNVTHSSNDKNIVQLDRGEELEVDHIVAGIGIEPDTALAQDAGLAVENGIIVDDYLRTNAPDIYAAGDVAAFQAPGLEERIRVEHEDNANTMGRIAGHNLAGREEPYHHLPMFYSDLFEYGYEAVGMLNARLKTYSNWQNPYERGVVFYLQDNKVRGVLLWNVWGKVDDARALIRAAKKHSENGLDEISESLLAR